MEFDKLKSKLAFTLAEVLIVLGIIGMIADLTLPSLVENYEKQYYVTGLKKAISEIEAAIKITIVSEGCINDLKCAMDIKSGANEGMISLNTKTQTFVNELAKNNIKAVVKNCGTNQTPCFGPLYYWGYNKSSRWGSTNNLDQPPGYLGTSSARFALLLADGVSASFAPSFHVVIIPGVSSHFFVYEYVLSLYIDINGPKPPNVFGRDTFWVYVRNDGSLIPYGSKYFCSFSSNPSSCNYWNMNPYALFCSDTNDYGVFCGGRIVEEGWKINYY